MRAGRLILIAGLLLATVIPAQAWMTFVSRDVSTGERIGMGANVFNENQDQVLSIVCTPQGLGAMFDTGLAVPGEAVPGELPTALLVAADGVAHDPFAVTLEPYNRGERIEMRLVLDPAEVAGLAQYVLGAVDTIEVRYRMGGQDLVTSFSNNSATISIGAVLHECEGRGDRAKTK
jgi:hypothetical protein